MFKVTCRKPIQQEHRYSMNMICLNESDEQHQPSCTARFTPAGSLRHESTARLPVQDAQAVRRQPWDVTTKSLVALCAWTVDARTAKEIHLASAAAWACRRRRTPAVRTTRIRGPEADNLHISEKTCLASGAARACRRCRPTAAPAAGL